ncbi:hypothetical protein [Telluribacter sp.]|jgi:hypothetical protein|uniref:hypothetical protein n=1 Tax=Telluribacter sp. TaxID=1978767 RepID=UPI002E12E94E|nr:hypothetical protein [Telluribacter sp.]
MHTIGPLEQTEFEELLKASLSVYKCTFHIEIDSTRHWLDCTIQNEFGTATNMHLTIPALQEILTTYEGKRDFEKALQERFGPEC